MFDTPADHDGRTIQPARPVAAKQQLRHLVMPFAKSDTRASIIQLINTGGPLLICLAGLIVGLDHDIWFALALIVPAAFFVVRLFIIQHDCGHGSFFKSRRANDALGWIVGMVTLMPYAAWREDHDEHHASSGNLERRGIGDVTTLTVREYLALSLWRRLAYRLYRHPLVFFGVGPAYLLLIRYRVPTGHPLRDWHGWLSVLGTNAAVAALAVAMALTVGVTVFFLAYLPVLLLATGIGIWLFYVQHQFEDSYWAGGEDWDFRAAALEGSSYYDLPAVLRWLTGSIGFHHIHHLASNVPNYRLLSCFEQVPELQQAKRLTLIDSLKCPRLALWDEERRKLVSFRQALSAAPPDPALCA